MTRLLEKAIVEIADVSFSYTGEPILSNVSLTIREKDFMAFIGPNGGGKSTLLRLILGLIKPDRGDIRILGGRPCDHSTAIGYVPQNFNFNQNFPVTALDVVLMGALNAKRLPGASRDRAMEMLSRLEVEDQALRKIGQMSGGQRQRVFIARALMTDPVLLLLDEPTASIDTKGQADFFALLEELNRQMAIVVVSHDLFVISNYAKSVACVNRNLHYHPHEEITGSMLETMYACSVEDVCRVQVMSTFKQAQGL